METTEQPLFTILEDRNGIKHKVVNFDNEIYSPKTGIIEIEAIRKTSRHENYASIPYTKDHKTGIIYGIVIGINDKTNELSYQKVSIGDGAYLDLSNPIDRRKYIVLKHAHFVAGSPLAQGKPRYKIVDREAEAKKIIAINKKKRHAEDIIDDLRIVEMYDMARTLGLPVETSSPDMVKSELIKFVAKPASPGHGNKSGGEQFLDIWDDVHRPILIMLKRCLATGVVNFDMNKGYVTKNNIPLGTSEPQVINYLLKNTSILLSLDNESKALDKALHTYGENDAYKKSILEVLGNTNQSPERTESMFEVKDFNKAQNEVLERAKIAEEEFNKRSAQMDEKMKQMNEMMERMSNVPPVETKQAESVITEEMKHRAVAAGVKSIHVYKNPEKLEQAIKDAEELSKTNFE